MIVEIVNRSGTVLDHYQFDKNEIRIGRAYDNDLILHDDFVDPHHLVLSYGQFDNDFIFSDLASVNGTKVLERSHRARSQGNFISSGVTLHVGKTFLRVRHPEHEVSAAIPISRWDNILTRIGSIWVQIIIVLVLAGMTVLGSYIDDPGLDGLAEDSLELIYPIIIACVYAGIWSFFARTQKIEGRFMTHASLALVYMLVMSLNPITLPIILYNLSLSLRYTLVETIMEVILIFGIVYASMYLATRAKKIRRAIVASLVPTLVCVFYISNQVKKDDFQARPPYDSYVVPALLSLRPSVTKDQFLREVETLYREPSKAEEQIE